MAKAKSVTDESCTGATDVQTVEVTSGTDVEGTGETDGEGTSGTDVEGTSGTDGEGTGGTDGEGTGGTDGEGTGGTDGEETNESEEVPMRLIAVSSILFESHLYKPGDELPTHNLEMNDAWIEAGTAEWRNVETNKALKASPVSAAAGLPGSAIPSSGEDLIGRVPGIGRKR